jgi:hypothetical protein
MSTNRFARPRAPSRRNAEPKPDLEFDPVVMRERADGWLPERQVEFIEALAECGCVSEACERIGMSLSAAYQLRRRPDAVYFRRAWNAAVAHAIRRLSDAAMSRALHGVVRPVFYQGEQIGERRYFDERLTQFLLRHNDPVNYGRWRDMAVFDQSESAPARLLAREINALGVEAWHRAHDMPPLKPAELPRAKSPEEQDAEDERRFDDYWEEARQFGRDELLAEQAAAAAGNAIQGNGL